MTSLSRARLSSWAQCQGHQVRWRLVKMAAGSTPVCKPPGGSCSAVALAAWQLASAPIPLTQSSRGSRWREAWTAVRAASRAPPCRRLCSLCSATRASRACIEALAQSRSASRLLAPFTLEGTSGARLSSARAPQRTSARDCSARVRPAWCTLRWTSSRSGCRFRAWWGGRATGTPRHSTGCGASCAPRARRG